MQSNKISEVYATRRLGDRVFAASLRSQHEGSLSGSRASTPPAYGEIRPPLQGRSTERFEGGRFSSPTSTSSPRELVDHTALYTDSGGTGAHDNFRVAVRVRPPLPRELNGYRPFVNVVQVMADQPDTLSLCDAMDTEDGHGTVYSRQSYTFDRVYGPEATQEVLYQSSARPAVLSVMEGYNATLIAYGQTGTGKTYTMEGFTSEEDRGIVPRAVEDIFAYLDVRRQQQQQRGGGTAGDAKFLVRASYLQIYNEVIFDLLQPPIAGAANGGWGASTSSSGFGSAGRGVGGGNLVVRHTPQRGVYVDGLSEWVVRTPEDVYGLIAKGTALRATGSTRLSELSSRSHAIFTIVVEAREGDEANPLSYRYGKLHIVDLAGSEKIRLAGVTGQRLEETKSINKSLHELGNVIAALANKSNGHHRRTQRHIPFRNSALTSALRDSLGGNCKTTLIACISPALESYAESLSTLQFANRAKNIENHAVVNEGVTQETLLRAYEQELQRLRAQLRTRMEGPAGALNPSDTSELLTEMEEGCRRAEADRQAALEALKKSSVAHEEEVRIRQELEARICELEAITREGGMEGKPRTSQEYADRLLELDDRERQAMAEGKEQVDRYKHLLLKQRDIMLSLTTRLNDRDETILLLQEELDAYDEHVEQLEKELEYARCHGAVGARPSSPSSPVQASLAPSSAALMVNPHAVGNTSEAQATEYVRQRRVQPKTGAAADLQHGEPQLYHSLLQPARTVTAEQLAIELVMLQGRRDGPTTTVAAAPAAQGTAESEGNGTVSASELSRMVQQRATSIAYTHYNAQVSQLRATIAALTLQLHNSEYRAHVAEEEVQQFARQESRGHGGTDRGVSFEEVQRALRAEWEWRRKAYAAAMEAVHDALQTDSTERGRLAREIDRLRVEVQHLLENATIDASQRTAISRVWQRIQDMEEKVRLAGTLAKLPALPSSDGPADAHLDILLPTRGGAAVGQQHADTESNQPYNGESILRTKSKEQQRRITQLESDAAAAASRSLQGGTSTNYDGMAAEVEKLKGQLAAHEKDRRALRTILDQRMRAKIDRLCALLAVIPVTSGSEGEGKLMNEARSLQGLIEASIKAMDADA